MFNPQGLQDALDTMRENTGPSRDLQLMRKAKAAKKPGSQCTYPAADGSEVPRPIQKP